MEQIVSIVFVHFGMDKSREELAIRSYKSLYESAKDLPTELIVVDNGGSLKVSKFFLEETEAGRITHYIRNSDNVWFGQARNQGLRIATGEYLAVVDNDLVYHKDWLKVCLGVLRQTKGQKLMVSPMPVLRCHKKHTRKKGFACEGKEYLVNWRVGSNCWLMHREDYLDIGEFIDHHFSGSKWTNRYSRMGYALVVIPGNLVRDEGTIGYIKKSKLDKQKEVVIKKRLLNGQEIIYWKGEQW